jgi:hypothetical protein
MVDVPGHRLPCLAGVANGELGIQAAERKARSRFRVGEIQCDLAATLCGCARRAVKGLVDELRPSVLELRPPYGLELLGEAVDESLQRVFGERRECPPLLRWASWRV